MKKLFTISILFSLALLARGNQVVSGAEGEYTLGLRCCGTY